MAVASQRLEPRIRRSFLTISWILSLSINRTQMAFLSIVSPVYRAENIIPELVRRIEDHVKQITADYEIILVEDCGPDSSWDVIERIARQSPHVIGIKLSRNFGQHHAITAGLDYATGDWVVVMDCDLQDQPEEIMRMLQKTEEGYDIVLARRHERKDGFFKKLYSKIFYRSLGYLTGSHQDESVANFGIYSRKVIDEIKRLRESIRFFPAMVKWVGFPSTKIDVEHASRSEGTSSYNFRRMVNLALDIILAYSVKPLRLTIALGLFIASLSMIMAAFTFIKWVLGQIQVIGYASLIISIWFLSGCLLITLGIVGLYIGKTFEGVKNRPLYIVNKITNGKS